MKRDFDLIRNILSFVETLKPGSHAIDHSFTDYLKLDKDYDRDVILEHVNLLYEEKFIDGKVCRDQFSNLITSVCVTRLTWKGYDFLDATRDNTIWNKAKNTILKPTVSLTYSLLFEWLKQEAKAKIGLL